MRAPVELLRTNRDYRRYALARLSSTIGTTVAPLGLAFAIIEAGGGAAALGLVLMGGLLVFIAVTPAAGVLADRLPRLSIIVACQIICGVCQLVAGVLVLRGAAAVWSLVALQMVAGAAGAFFQPAVKGLLPQLVPSGPMLSHANALLQIADNAVAILGPGLAGLVIALSSPGIILAWDGATFLASAALFLTLRLPPSPRRERRRFLADLAEGWAAFRSRRWLWMLTVVSALTSACWAAGVSVLGPVYATRYLDGAVSWGLVTSAIGIGLACGSIISLLFPPARVGRLMCLTPIPVALLLAGMATGAPLLALAGAGALTGAGGTLQLIAWTSYLQQAIPTEQLSRIVATNALIATLLVPIAYAVAGPAAELVGVRAVLGGCAVIVLGGAVIAACSRDVQQLIKATS
ncbi:MFS transporter [[Actinomadura] parvosata]|uniref:MFS transporter n=1 Tax=[Actinomadura] parvosata TaxID=1955412 RepID=UPI00406CB71E